MLDEWTNEHHRFFVSSEYEHLPSAVFELFRGEEQVFRLPISYHRDLHTHAARSHCLKRGKRQKCHLCDYGLDGYCGIRFIRRWAAKCRAIRVVRPRIDEFPCVRGLVEACNSRKAVCGRKSDCCKQGLCLCSSCQNFDCEDRRGCWPNSAPMTECENYFR